MQRFSTTSAARSADARVVDPDAESETVCSRVAGEIIAALGHELRSPLNGIEGLTDLLAAETLGPLNDKQREFVAMIAASGRRLRSVLEDVERVAAPDGKWVDDDDAYSLEDVIERVATLMRQVAAAEEVQLTVRPGDTQPGDLGLFPTIRRIAALLGWALMQRAEPGDEIVLSADAAPRASGTIGVALRAQGAAALEPAAATEDEAARLAGVDDMVAAARRAADAAGLAVAAAVSDDAVLFVVRRAGAG